MFNRYDIWQDSAVNTNSVIVYKYHSEWNTLKVV